MMHDQQRNYYLQVMGIQRWILRDPVLACDDEMAELAESGVQRSSPAGGAGDAIAATKEANSNRLASGAASGSSATNEAIVFTLHAIACEGHCLVIDEGTPGDTPESATRRTALISGIVQALGVPKTCKISRSSFSLPAENNAEADSAAKPASQALSGFATACMHSAQAKYIVLLGNSPKRYLFERESDSASKNCGQCLGLPAVCGASASEMLAEPTLKRALWAAMQHMLRPS